MVYAATSFFILGLLLLGTRMYVPEGGGKPQVLQYAGLAALLLIVLSCAVVAYAGMAGNSGKSDETAATVSGDFGLSGNAQANTAVPSLDMSKPTGAPQELAGGNATATPATGAAAQNPFGQKDTASGVPSVFSMAQASQICAGFSDVAMGALLAGSRGEPFPPYEEKARQLSEQVMRLPFVREAGSKPMQYISTLFGTLVEDQYYISPQNRAVQLGLIGKVDKKLALDAMNQVCELKILEIRAK
ncbi:hypothetical protein UNDYM_5053 [Undibacterium sp. YM2]|uniref:hypothetical protein n=1 Tax=Undibacterium sp. YM2 TaxID=2058625 RepID=UPI001331CCA3|nr:hypothetical protein [Undibacterium sp. YM2]BBB69306.1 hypothetical protein UNDYM_5053 [Undibacterium sp. YM2]